MENPLFAVGIASTAEVIVIMNNQEEFHRTRMQKERIIENLKERGCRITKQRQILLDIILENDCASCKEIYYKASCQDKKIGTATVYRMINMLEEIGAISRKNMYRVDYGKNVSSDGGCIVRLDDDTEKHLNIQNWNHVIEEGLQIGRASCRERV